MASIEQKLIDRAFGVTDPQTLQLVNPPVQVWAVKSHKHTAEGVSSDLGVLAYDEKDAREKLVAQIGQEKHTCDCKTCKRTREESHFPDEVNLIRVK